MTETVSALVVLCTAPSAEVADRLAPHVVEQRLAACVNIVGGVRSVFRWEGTALTAALVEQHPYDVPEVIALPAAGGRARYLRWVGEQSAP